MNCKACDFAAKSPHSLAGHVGAKHKMTMEEYHLKYFFGGTKPFCKADQCDGHPLFIRGKNRYREYCPEHANLSRAEWNKKNMGFNPGWRKGLTKEEHAGISSQAEAIKGENNPWHKMILSDPEAAKMAIEKSSKARRPPAKEARAKLLERGLEWNNSEQYKNRLEKNIKVRCVTCHKDFVTSYANLLNADRPCCNCYPKDPPWAGRRHSEATKKKLSDINKYSEEEFAGIKEEIEKSRLRIITPYVEYHSKFQQKLDIECIECGHKSKRTLWALQQATLCHRCQPRSTPQMKLQEFLENNGIQYEYNCRSLIPPHEVDIFIPSANFAIEYDGLYWHQEKYKGKKYHREKTQSCAEKGVQLFHIFSDEWEDNPTIIKSMLLHRLNKTPEKAFARKCHIKKVSLEEKRSFFNNMHIAGDTRSCIAFGLYLQGELVACVSLRKPFVKKHGNVIEIARFATRLNLTVVGGFSKIFKHIKKWSIESGYDGILTYADLRFGTGGVYTRTGFEFIGETPIDYFYSDGKVRHGRFKYRAQPGKPEKIVAEENGVFKVYGCGHNTFIYRLEH